MSSRPKPRISLAPLSGLFLMFALILVSSLVVAQSDSNPKWDLFVGYQWLHPGGTVPAAFGDPAAPTPSKIPDMDKGFGSALTYNFDRYWGLEADFGHNWGSSNYETTGSGGPRFMVRTEGANYFLHALVSYNRLSVSGLNPSNGIGAILGGGMDLAIWKKVSLRLRWIMFGRATTSPTMPTHSFRPCGVLLLKASGCGPVLFSTGVELLS